MQADPSLTRPEVEQYLEEYALKDDFTGPEYNDTWGHGKLRVAELVSYLDVPLTGSRAILPGSLTLNAYPNPFNASVSLQVQLKNRQTVRLAIFDLLGREVAVIYEGILGPGAERFTWQAEGMSSGIYWATLESDLDQTAKKVVVLK
ncbi:MAG TPA: T9SS type A sorting domain-containing protein [Bacteroidetes bacterium]|nr:T9SS type A sorting domain-containing protein [Bacteroidota bacterium]